MQNSEVRETRSEGCHENDGDFVDIILLYRRFGQKSEGKTPLGRGDTAETINTKGH